VCFWSFLETQVENPKPPFAQPVGVETNELQQSFRREIACKICGALVRLDKCKIDEDGRAVHERCYFEKVSARNNPEI
jgi:hypothetical protein